MAITATLDGNRLFSLSETGFGLDWRPGFNPEDWIFDNVYAWPVDNGPSPITLMPATEHPDWETTISDTGVYARDRLSHYSQLSGANSFEEFTHLHSKDYVFLSRQQNAQLLSHDFAEAGSGISVNLWAAGTGKGFQNVLTTEFGHTDTSKRYRLNVREDGRGFLARGTGINPEDQLAEGWLVPNRWGSIVGRWIKIHILPHGRNRLLISSSAGHGFVWEDKSLSRADPKGRDVPVTQRAPIAYTLGAKTAFQASMMAFAGGDVGISGRVGGTLTPKPGNSLFSGPYKPGTGVPPVTGHVVTYDTSLLDIRNAPRSGAPVVQPVLIAQFPLSVHFNAVQTPAKRWDLQPTVTLSRPALTKRHEKQTPILYRIEPYAEPTTLSHTNAGTDFADDIIHLSHNHERETLSGNLQIRNAQNHSAYKQAFNIPFEWAENDNVYLSGLLVEPKYNRDGDTEYLSWTLADWNKRFEETPVASLGRFDGMTLSDAMKKTLIGLGLPKDGSMWSIHETQTTAEGNGLYKLSKGETDDDPMNLPDAVRSGADWIKYLREFTSSSEEPFQWIVGWMPVVDVSVAKFRWKFVFWDPARLSLTPVKTFFPTHSMAEVHGGARWDQSYMDVTEGEWTDIAVEPDANDLWVFGLTSDDKPLVAHNYDKTSWNSATALGSRPANWLGYRKQFVEYNTALNTQEQVNAYNGLLFKRMNKARKSSQFQAQWERSVTKWSVVRIYETEVYPGVKGTDYNDWKVLGFSIPDHLLDDATYPVRPSTYRVERWLS